MLGAFGSLIGGATDVAKAVSDSKAAHQLEKLQRHIRAMEGRELYLAPYKHGKRLYFGLYKRGQGIILKKKRRKNVKNSHRYNNEYTIGSTGKAHAHAVLLEVFLCVTRYR